MKLHIAEMLRSQKKPHISFHTPGHKRAGWDITELGYSDNLYSPHGVIAAAERDAAEILKAERSFFLTDGSTAGVFSALWCAKEGGARRIALPAFSHPSAFHACLAIGLEVVAVPQNFFRGIPVQPPIEALAAALGQADALFLTSPDYYGNFPPLSEAKELCAREKKPLLIDGAHGSHLHFCPLYAGNFADVWVDGVHKSLPAPTQGAVVSAKTEEWGERLKRAVRLFRTTSPSYPILAGVEYAVKYPRNEDIENRIFALKARMKAYPNADWSKMLIPFGSFSSAARAALERKGIYPEFDDGNYLLFYFSPATKPRELKKLERALAALPRGEVPEGAKGAVPIYSEEE